MLCDCCSDPIDRGDRAAVLSNGEHIHDGCYQIVQAAAEEVRHDAGHTSTVGVLKVTRQRLAASAEFRGGCAVGDPVASIAWYAQISSSE